MQRTGRVAVFVVFVVMVSYGSAVIRSRASGGVEVYDVLTCMGYDSSYHVPVGVRDYFENDSPHVTLWANMSRTDVENITVLWFSPEGLLAYSEAGSTVYESSYWRGVTSELPGDVFSSLLGVWSVELLVDDELMAGYSFNVIDKEGEEWGLHTRILDLESPDKVKPNTNFTVQITVYYKFSNVTVLTPGLWNPLDGSLIVEDHDELEGEGTKVYGFTVQSPDQPGDYTIDAAVFYLYDGEWFIDDGGLTSFQLTVESGAGLLSQENLMVTVTVLVTAIVVLVVWKRR